MGVVLVNLDERTTLYLKVYRERWGTLPSRLTEFRITSEATR